MSYPPNLASAQLWHANLVFANLGNANLNGATLFYTNLTGANLSGANLTGANLSGVNLIGHRWLGEIIGTPYYDAATNLANTWLDEGTTSFDPVAAGWTLVPEPSTALLLGLGLAGLAARRRVCVGASIGRRPSLAPLAI